MNITMDDKVKRWTAKRKSALVIEIIQGKTTVSEASRSYDLSPAANAADERIPKVSAVATASLLDSFT